MTAFSDDRELPPMIIAHRGASFSAPENTLAAIAAAWRAGADAVEVDIRLTADQRIVLMHDPSTRRTTGKHHIVSGTESAIIRNLDAGSWKDACFAGERVPFFNDVIDTVPPGKRLFIEIKSGTEILPVLEPLVRSVTCTFIGFDIDVMARCKETMPEYPAYWLHEPSRRFWIGPRRVPDTGTLIDALSRRGLDGIDMQHGGIDRALCRAMAHAGLDVAAWTVDDPDTAQRLLDMGVGGITTNRPELLKTHGL